MRINIIPFSFELDTIQVAGSCIWSLALYIGLDSTKKWIAYQLERWFNFAEGWMYTSTEEFEKTRPARESQNAFYASVMSILPFLLLGFLSKWGVDISLGSSWSISLGIVTCIGAGVYALGRQDGQFDDT